MILYIGEISLQGQQRICADVGYVFVVKINLYLKIKYTLEITYQPAVKLHHFSFTKLKQNSKNSNAAIYSTHIRH